MILKELFTPTLIELVTSSIRPIIQYKDDSDNVLLMDGTNFRFMDGGLFEIMEQQN